jgi:hypothetical protein
MASRNVRDVANGTVDVARWKKGNQMRYKAVFIAGFAVGFVAGARSGRETYDKLVGYGRQVAEHPKVQEATTKAQAKATELGKTAAAKAPDYAKSAAASATSAAKAASAQVPQVVTSAKNAAADKLPRQFGGNNAGKGEPDDVAADGNLVYPADSASASNGARYTPDDPDAR